MVFTGFEQMSTSGIAEDGAGAGHTAAAPPARISADMKINELISSRPKSPAGIMEFNDILGIVEEDTLELYTHISADDMKVALDTFLVNGEVATPGMRARC